MSDPIKLSDARVREILAKQTAENARRRLERDERWCEPQASGEEVQALAQAVIDLRFAVSMHEAAAEEDRKKIELLLEECARKRREIARDNAARERLETAVKERRGIRLTRDEARRLAAMLEWVDASDWVDSYYSSGFG